MAALRYRKPWLRAELLFMALIRMCALPANALTAFSIEERGTPSEIAIISQQHRAAESHIQARARLIETTVIGLTGSSLPSRAGAAMPLSGHGRAPLGGKAISVGDPFGGKSTKSSLVITGFVGWSTAVD